jgi:hypothetical protein
MRPIDARIVASATPSSARYRVQTIFAISPSYYKLASFFLGAIRLPATLTTVPALLTTAYEPWPKALSLLSSCATKNG